MRHAKIEAMLVLLVTAACGGRLPLEPSAVPGGGGGATNAADAGDASIADMTCGNSGMTVLATYCAMCHGGRTPGERYGNPPFDFVLDVQKLTTLFTLNTSPPMLFVKPGDPDHSRVYERAARGEMPPRNGLALPRPTASDLSLLRFWIESCLGASPTGSGGAGGSSGAGGASGGTGGLLDAGACGVAMGDDGGAPSAIWPSDDACAGDQLPIVGTWQGYVENIVFASGSDVVRMVIRAANATHVCGTVTLGNAMTPPPANPDIGYPPGIYGCPPQGPARNVAHFDGFPMTMLAGRTTGPRLQFEASVDEMWRTWCELQVSYPVADDPRVHSCVPYASYGAGRAVVCPGRDVECGKQSLCLGALSETGPCKCTANGCTADPALHVDPSGHLTFDVRVIDTNVDGSVNVDGTLHNVHLTRVP